MRIPAGTIPATGGVTGQAETPANGSQSKDHWLTMGGLSVA